MATKQVNNKQINKVPDVFKGATFEEIQTNLISYLRGQEEFQDYDFKGSRLNVLVGLLSYSILYNQQFANGALYESFIRTASLRSSVVQSAQDNGYLPASKTCAKDSIIVSIAHPLKPRTIKIPRGTKFIGTVQNTDGYSFVTSDDVVVVRNSSNTYTSMLNLIQGRIMRIQTVYDGSDIIIRDTTIDRDQIRLYVDGAPWKDWSDKSIVNITGSTQVFYKRETVDGSTQIYFGEGDNTVDANNGVLTSQYVGGLKPAIGSVVVLEYLATAGEPANGATSYAYVDTLENLKVTDIITNPSNSRDYIGSDGGGEPEDIERIRELAPVMRETQRRCVTASDYEAFVSQKFGSIVQAIQCFTDKEKPGYAFIAIKPKSGLRLTSIQKEDVQQYLKEFNLAPITPSILDPNYLYIKQVIKVDYELSALSESEEWLRGNIIDSIDRYFIENVELFNKSYSKSKMLTYVDNTDVSIIGSSAELQLVRELDNFYSSPMSGITFLNQVIDGSIYSSDITFSTERVDSDDEIIKYPVHYVSTRMNQDGDADILVGPFANNDIKITEYTGTNFNKLTQDGRNKYYKVGSMNYYRDFIEFDLGILNKPNKFSSAYIELYATPTETNIYTRDGSLIVFENNLRPQYLELNLGSIAK